MSELCSVPECGRPAIVAGAKVEHGERKGETIQFCEHHRWMAPATAVFAVLYRAVQP